MYNPPLVSPVRVEAHRSGKMFLHFREDWVGAKHISARIGRMSFPLLFPFVNWGRQNAFLRLNRRRSQTTWRMSKLSIKNMLEINLIPSMEPTWFIIRRTNPDLTWCRPAYYFAALFVLSSVVRYQPELMFQVTSTNSKWNWFLRRFIDRAERFYPHLMFSWTMDQVYFFE